MRCALVNVSISDVKSLPIGVLWLKQNMVSFGHDVSIADYQLADGELADPENLKQFCLSLNADIIGLSVTCAALPTMLCAVELLKSEAPDVIIIAGGSGVCDRPEQIMNAYPIDYIVVGEGEVAGSRLLAAIDNNADPSLIPGVVSRHNGQVVVSPPMRITDVSSLVTPDYEAIDFADYDNTAAIVTQRGCPFNCHFCSAHSVWGRKVVARTTDSVVTELQSLAGGVETIEFHDDTFALRGQGLEIMAAMKEAGVSVPWGCNCRADMMSYELGMKLAQMGCSRVLIGTESGSDRVLTSIGKGVTVNQCRLAIKAVLDTVGQVTTSYIWGFPDETIDDLADTLMTIADDSRLSGIRVQFGLLSPLPGSQLGQNANELELIDELNPGGLMPQDVRIADYPMLHEAVKKHRNIFQAHYCLVSPEFEQKLNLVQSFLSFHGGGWK